MFTIVFYVNFIYFLRNAPFVAVPHLIESKSGSTKPCHQFRTHRPTASEILSHSTTPLSFVIVALKQEALVTLSFEVTSTLFSAIKKMDCCTTGSHTAFQKYFGTTVFTVGTLYVHLKPHCQYLLMPAKEVKQNWAFWKNTSCKLKTRYTWNCNISDLF